MGPPPIFMSIRQRSDPRRHAAQGRQPLDLGVHLLRQQMTGTLKQPDGQVVRNIHVVKQKE